MQKKDKWNIGRVISFKEERGFGFIKCWGDDNEYFFHISSVKTKPIAGQDYVIFKLRPSYNKPGTTESFKIYLLTEFDEDIHYLFAQFSKFKDEGFRKIILETLAEVDVIFLLEKELRYFSAAESKGCFEEIKEELYLFLSIDDSEELKNGILRIISTWTESLKLSYNRVESWIYGLTQTKPEFKILKKYFLEADRKKQLSVLIKTANDITTQKKLVIEAAKSLGAVGVLDFITDYCRQINSLIMPTETVSEYRNAKFWFNKHGYDIYKSLIDYLKNSLDGKQKFSLFLNGYIDLFPKDYIVSKNVDLTKEQIKSLLESNMLSSDDTLRLVVNSIDKNLNKFDEIENEEQLIQFNGLIEDHLSVTNNLELITAIKSTISRWAIDNSTSYFTVQLWLDSIILEDPEYGIIEDAFLVADEYLRLKILTNIKNISIKKELIKVLLIKEKPIDVLDFIDHYLIKVNNLPSTGIKHRLIDKSFWTDKTDYELFLTTKNYIEAVLPEDIKLSLFFDHYIDSPSEDYILTVSTQLNKYQVAKILHSKLLSKTNLYNFIINILNKEIKTILSLIISKDEENETEENNYEESLESVFWILEEANKNLSVKRFAQLEKKVLSELPSDLHIELWERHLIKNIPKNLLEYFDDDKEKYTKITNWLKKQIINNQEISDILYKRLLENIVINNRPEFYTAYNIISKLTEIDSVWIDKIHSLDNGFFDVLLWHFGFSSDFDFNMLKGKFIYFTPDDQVYIFKRLFYLKHTGFLDFSIEVLDDIVRADIDMYLANKNFTSDFVLDISTHTIIEAIKSFVNNKHFYFESDLILKDLINNSDKKFKLDHYFDECQGRQIALWNWHTDGIIKKIKFPNDRNKFYYSIDIDVASRGEEYARVFVPGLYDERIRRFREIVENVKKIPGRKWNSEKNHWGIPSKYEKEVFAFAATNHFFFDFDGGNRYANNIHLVNFERSDIPNGLRFCEGRKSNKNDSTLKTPFWWCANQKCFSNAEVDHLKNNTQENKKQPWEHYTFLDILRVLGINTDEQKASPVDYIPDGHYYKFIGHINAFNRLVEKMYCDKCGQLLYPVESSHFALYRVVSFNCENNNCSEYKKNVYLNHCLNGECTNIIDSRVSQRCENGMYICNNCGTCCSTEMFQRRLKNLRSTGGYIHPQLIRNVEEKNGHLEKAEYYCYSCKGMMTEYGSDKYICKKCNVTYDLEKFKWLSKKWIMKHKRREDYPTI